jgi:hypothetical protein
MKKFSTLIRLAILQRRCIRIVYDPGRRFIEPHAFGYGSDGQLLLRAFQTSGASASKEPIHWKLFRIDRIEALSLCKKCFLQPRPEYVKNDSILIKIIIQL